MGFDDMSKRQPVEDMTPSTDLERFNRDVELIFPNAAPSRLARACGNVAPRTAQKWLSGHISPIPQDVLDFVAEQKAALAKGGFDAKLQGLIEDHAAGMDREAIASWLAYHYFEFTGSAVE